MEMGSPVYMDVLGQGVSDKYLRTLTLSFRFQLTFAKAIIIMRYLKSLSKSLLLTIAFCQVKWTKGKILQLQLVVNRKKAETQGRELESAARTQVSEQNQTVA